MKERLVGFEETDKEIREKKKNISKSEEIPERRRQRQRDSGSIVWGLMFIFAGITFLLNNMGVVPWTIWNLMFQFWPILLVFAGLQMIMGEGIVSKFLLGVLAVLVFLSIFAYGLRETGSPLFSLWSLDQIPWLNVFNYLNSNE